MSAPTFPQDRAAFRQAVADVAAKAKAILPQAVNGRVESAVKLVLQGDVEPLEDGSIQVGSSEPTRYYRLVGTACTCTDFTQGKAPSGWCKHRIAAGIQKRVRELLPPTPDQDDNYKLETPAPPLPEAPASVNVRVLIQGHETQITLRDTNEAALLARLQALLKRADIKPIPPRPAPRSGGWKPKQYQGR